MLSRLILILYICHYVTNGFILHNTRIATIINSQTALNAKREGGETGTSKRGGGSRDTNIRQSRVARSLRDELSSIICDVDIKAVNYPDENLLKATTIVDIDLSADLTYAKVFVSVLGNSVEKRQIFVWLCENVGQVRYSLAQRLRHMRRVPEIFFKLSDQQGSADLVSLIDSFETTKAVNNEDEFEFEEDDE
jgi:ribosome-binding factor A|mmetsp:Transcript_27778/g.26588  ORF Transcript_27778/g.26588 Transcript_27778/m.26588 type:complete len:193 (-) Transcript_27778:383-961(-)